LVPKEKQNSIDQSQAKDTECRQIKNKIVKKNQNSFLQIYFSDCIRFTLTNGRKKDSILNEAVKKATKMLQQQQQHQKTFLQLTI